MSSNLNGYLAFLNSLGHMAPRKYHCINFLDSKKVEIDHIQILLYVVLGNYVGPEELF